MKLHATITNENGKQVSKGGNKKLNIRVNVGDDEIAVLTLQHENNVVEAMNYHQKTSGYVLRNNEGSKISFKLDK